MTRATRRVLSQNIALILLSALFNASKPKDNNKMHPSGEVGRFQMDNHLSLPGDFRYYLADTMPTKATVTLAELPNLGPRSAEMLAKAGIYTRNQLEELGPVKAYLATKQAGAKPSMNILLPVSPRLLTCGFITVGLLLLSLLSTANGEDHKGVSFGVPGLESGNIQLDEKGKYRLFVQSAAVQSLSDAQFAILRQYDETLQKKTDTKSAQRSHALVIAIARAGNAKSLLYLGEQFETSPERRNNVAEGLSYYAREKKLRDSDWRLMVRSLNVVEGKQAEEVIDALLHFRRRANKAQWIRQLIIVGLSLEEKGAAKVVKLVEHWGGSKPVKPTNSAREDLKMWQVMFAQKYPEEPPATLPIDAKESKWKYNALRIILSEHRHDKIDLKQGKQVFTKGSCFKCHRIGEEGEKIGPNLTNIGKKMQEKEILQAILFPSQFIPEEYPTTTLETKDGKIYTGMMGTAGPETLLILNPDGKKVFIYKKNVKNILSNKKSAMPDKLLEGLSQAEIIQLFGYIRSFANEGAAGFHKKK